MEWEESEYYIFNNNNKLRACKCSLEENKKRRLLNF